MIIILNWGERILGMFTILGVGFAYLNIFKEIRDKLLITKQEEE